MKGHIAFCPHFHQPHFQLHKTREEAYKNSYLPWLELLKQAVKLDKFYINIHFSGPFLYWFTDQKPEYLDEFRKLMGNNKIGLIGGLADEAFIQLSPRNDDYLYQLHKYNQILSSATGIGAKNWQGIHIVERECGELLLKELTYAAQLIDALPIYYLDAETFFNPHFSYPGSESDYCSKHFGFSDPVSITTISHIPSQMLHFAFRDEIGGQEFFVLPVHSLHRYQLLKRQAFTTDDRVKISPDHYLFYLKDALEKAFQLARSYGREIEPIVVIFEDAEKFGQWSKDPEGDTEWLLEFFNLVEQDKDLQFTGLKDYLLKQGFLDTYPVSTSHSYTEWENWTARRGIRGVTLGDERLRRVVSRLRDVESLQQEVEEAIINKALQPGKQLASAPGLSSMVKRALLQSSERFDLVKSLMEDSEYQNYASSYELANRVRNMVYQEDPKWASRHPGYGSSPYYDVQGLAYLEMAEKMLKELNQKLGNDISQPLVEVKDWDFDGRDELLVQNQDQTLVLDTKGGCISYHHVIASSIANNDSRIAEIVENDMKTPGACNSIYRYSYPLVFTETDSSMALKYYNEGGRKEICRNSLRCNILALREGEYQAVGGFDTAAFTLERVNSDDNGVTAEMSCEQTLDMKGNPVIRISKRFVISKGAVNCFIEALIDREIDEELILEPQLVTSAAPSDEVYFKPRAFLGLYTSLDQTPMELCLEETPILDEGEEKVKRDVFRINLARPIDFVFKLDNNKGHSFYNRVSYKFKANSDIEQMAIEPGVKFYYQGYVFAEQSRLGYHSSGLNIKPRIKFTEKRAVFSVETCWDLDGSIADYDQILELIKE